MNEQERQQHLKDVEMETGAFTGSSDFLDPEQPFAFQLAPLPGVGVKINSYVPNYRKDLQPEKVLSRVGFGEIAFEDLDEDLRKGFEMNSTLQGSPISWKGRKQDPNVRIFANKDRSTLYTIEYKDRDRYAWSRTEKGSNGYTVREGGKASPISELITGIGFYEIAHAKAPEAYPQFRQPEKTPVMIRTGADHVAETVRSQTEDIIGLA